MVRQTIGRRWVHLFVSLAAMTLLGTACNGPAGDGGDDAGSTDCGESSDDCDDGNPCTDDDRCIDGTCAGDLVVGCILCGQDSDCDDDDPCTDDSCGPDGVCGNTDNALPCVDGDPIDPIFPVNYRETFTEVRDCRGSNSHPSTIRVFVNEVGLEAYLADLNPLPVGTILVKETFDGLTCDNDDELTLLSALLKEAPGFDEEDSDWHWQDVQPDRLVLIDTKARCIGCHLACTDRDYMCALP